MESQMIEEYFLNMKYDSMICIPLILFNLHVDKLIDIKNV